MLVVHGYKYNPSLLNHFFYQTEKTEIAKKSSLLFKLPAFLVCVTVVLEQI